MKIAVVIPVHGSKKRLELAKRVILYYETMEVPGLDISVCPVGSSESIEGLGINIFSTPVDGTALIPDGPAFPLGLKFNYGISRFPGALDGGVMIVGSDDLIAPPVFERIRDAKPYYQEIKGVHFFNAQTGEMAYAWKSHCGAGKYFSAEFLDTCDWRPYDDEADKNVDNGPSRFITGGKDVVQASANRPLCIDIKCFGENMTAWEIVSGYQSEGLDKEACFKFMDGEWEARWRV